MEVDEDYDYDTLNSDDDDATIDSDDDKPPVKHQKLQ